ncbi:MAG TPA: hypothetical protein VFG72_05620 [Marmoricola sp.]|nr:hypothetical protein [Marmoricola sp.]
MGNTLRGNTGQRSEGVPTPVGGGACGIEGITGLVEPVLEEVAVGVERHGRRAVAEHLLDDLTSAPDAIARLAVVPERVRRQHGRDLGGDFWRPRLVIENRGPGGREGNGETARGTKLGRSR